MKCGLVITEGVGQALGATGVVDFFAEDGLLLEAVILNIKGPGSCLFY